MFSAIDCQMCNGKRTVIGNFEYDDYGKCVHGEPVECPRCHGTGNERCARKVVAIEAAGRGWAATLECGHTVGTAVEPAVGDERYCGACLENLKLLPEGGRS